jgi:hypothetical protein
VSRKSPQEKKVLSYSRDRRNDYGEHDKGSRRSIRRNKRTPHRADRRREHQVLAGATQAAEAEVAEARLARKPFKLRIARWQKSPDAPLGEYVEQRIRRRIALGVEDQAGGAERIERIRRRLRGRRVVYPHYIGWTND